MITVWGRTTSANLQIVAWALNEIGLPYQRIDAGGRFGGLDTPEYGRMNPNRLVPVLKDGDLVLWESAAIVRYLGAEYGDEAFWPADPAKRAPIDMWAEWIKTSFGPALLPGVFWQLMRRPENRDEAALEASVKRVSALALMLDARLGEGPGPHLGGEHIAFADIIVGTPLYRYFTLEFQRPETPHLHAYYDRLTERPAYAEHVMVSYDSLREK